MKRLENYLESLQRFGIAPGLERIRALLKFAGDPQQKYPVVLVGGTNGKGSTCEFLAGMMAEDGKRVGLYTSPHLYSWNERIRVLQPPTASRQPPTELFPGAISDEELDALFDEALPHIQNVAASELGQPTEFEVLTFLGLWHFARRKVDVAVVEVGLGGKWDATNATEPIVSAITHVALDHCDRLGNTVEEIARDKVEIARAGRVLVTAETKPEVLRVFEEFCRKLECRIQNVKLESGADFQEINFATARWACEFLYQALAWPVDTSSFIPTHLSFNSFPFSVPARFETIRQNPYIILDGANNPDGASTLSASLEQALGKARGAKLILVLGILQDKDYAAMIEVLAPHARAVIATQSNSPRAARAELIAQEARKYCAHVETSTPVMAAVHRALEIAGKSDIICVTGSFYTVAEVERADLKKISDER
jgi:dihydrofolate synthase/folylpolyglutamate synthase